MWWVYQWYVIEGWVAVLAVLNLGLALFTAVNSYNQNKRVWRVENRFDGLQGRLITTSGQISQLTRRMTGTHEPVPQAVIDEVAAAGSDEPTQVRKAKKGKKV